MPSANLRIIKLRNTQNGNKNGSIKKASYGFNLRGRGHMFSGINAQPVWNAKKFKPPQIYTFRQWSTPIFWGYNLKNYNLGNIPSEAILRYYTGIFPQKTYQIDIIHYLFLLNEDWSTNNKSHIFDYSLNALQRNQSWVDKSFFLFL